MMLLESGMSGWTVTLWTVVIIALSAFFVAAEFSLMAAKAHRLDERADTPAGRAAVKNASELTLVLAGSQLGITVCTLALGAITKPAVHHALTPVLETVGLPLAIADIASFILALIIVTFLHLVVGEMAPKSWAIAHPEDSSVLLALPMRAFMFVARPLLAAMNAAANWMVRRAGAEPVDGLHAGQDISGLRHLVEHSANVGALDAAYHSSLTSVLRLRDQTVRDALPAEPAFVAVGADATLADVQEATRRHRQLRVLIREDGRTLGVVHVRDTLAEPDLSRPALEIAREPVFLRAGSGLTTALAKVRRARTQIGVVRDGDAELGVLALEDLLPGLMPSAMVDAAG